MARSIWGVVGLVGLFLLSLFLQGAGFRSGEGVFTEPREAASAPSDTTRPWWDTDDLTLYHWSSTIQHWVGPEQCFVVASNLVNASGSQKLFVGAGADTTAAANHGMLLPYDFYVKRVMMQAQAGSGDCTGTDLYFITYSGGTKDTLMAIQWPDFTSVANKDTIIAEEIPSGTKWIPANKVNSGSAPDKPQALILGNRIVDP